MQQLEDLQLIELIRTQGDSGAIQELFSRYRPVMLRLKQNYYLPGHDLDDWEQEARLVLWSVASKFNGKRSSSFGAFYKLNLTHRVYDLIRQSQAKKRNAPLLSFESNWAYFADTLVDGRTQVGESVEIRTTFRELLGQLSKTEHLVLVELLTRASPLEISRKFEWELTRVVAAQHRCRLKLRRLLTE